MIKDYQIWKEQELPTDLRAEIDLMDQAMIDDAFGTDLSFGTAGMRGLLGCGTNRLNVYTINKATQGLAKYLLNKYPNKECGVAICYDSRHYSKEFSEVCGKTLATYGIKSYIFDDVKPTPLLSYLVRHHQLDAGIMITASHNPKQYNGYKVYNETGSQLNIDEANQVISFINDIEDIFDFTYNEDNYHLINYVGNEIEDDYLDEIKDLLLMPNINKDIKVVFTPEHGTSYEVMPRCFNYFGYNGLICVEEQMEPNGDFPNTPTSNPEDIRAFELAIKYAKEHNADIIIANDPDADRLGVMYKEGSEYLPLSGNQTGTLMIDYLLNHQKEIKDKILYKTIVTGEMGASIAKDKGISVKELLTGFKFIGEQIALLDDPSKYFFGYEESYGYLIKPIVRDKDAIQSAILIAEMAAYYKEQNKTLGQRLEQLYEQYGFYDEVTYSLSFDGPGGMDKIINAMKQARSINWDKIAGYEVSEIIDYTTPQGDLPTSDVVKYILPNVGWVVLRPSGTEPKLKVYVSVKQPTLALAKEVNEKLYDEMINQLGL